LSTAAIPDTTTTPETQSDYARAQLALPPHQQAAFDTATEHLTEDWDKPLTAPQRPR